MRYGATATPPKRNGRATFPWSSFPAGCKYCTRCPEVVDRCKTEEPPLVEVAPGHHVRCHLVDGDTGEGAQ